MHISEGILNGGIIISSSLLTTAIAGYLLYKIKPGDIARTACMSAVFFIGSFVHFPLGPSSLHLLLSGLVGAFSGAYAFLAILIALILQGLFFGFGGLSVLGVNALIIGAPAFLGAYFVRLGGNQTNAHKTKLYYFLAGALPVLISAILLSAVLLLNGEEFRAIASLAMLTNTALCVIEGFICVFILSFVAKTYPELLKCEKSLS